MIIQYRSYFTVDFHCTGCLPCVKIEVGGVNVAAIIIILHTCLKVLRN